MAHWWGDSAKAVAAIIWVLAGCIAILMGLAQPIAENVGAALAGVHGALGGRLGIPAAVLALALIGLIVFRRPFRLGRRRPALVLIALPSGVVAVLAALAVAAMAGAVVPGAAEVAAPALAIGLIVVAIQVLGEEVLLRGLLQPLLTRAWGAWLGVLLTALTFTLIHVLGGWRDPVSLLNITLAGIWFGLLALRTSGLLAPTLAHFGYNWGEEMLVGISPNPGLGDFGAIFDFDLVGPAILGGSVDGFNASLVLSVVLILLILPLALMRGRPDGAHAGQQAEARA
ncbi:hypothetical protein SAMN06295912_104114 [Sphingomonas laterariae]|uniref:CAAX prenyl protease 2/Lysostaphin resistance protein A-like domain-containing protein n=1 Tax=Edaphosphingomonas laterariae TaxID=861865 RepID=A0A239DHQ0_9SPHN|nr:CPBP family intramembrane glutamic endopeptidase [Sphingomonas laterariae]SNS31940.1 hypothetical protein SAMN06295912_104114 [Sphingomonas laterariae]